MNNKFKIAVLILVFVVPGLFFIFLKMFGSNHYDIPILSGRITCFSLVESKILNDLSDAKVILINRQATHCQDCNEEIDQLKRIYQRYGTLEGFRMVILSADSAKYGLTNNIPILSFYPLDKNSQGSTCFPATTDNELLLIDEQRQLRGNYQITRADVDRLMTELDILYGNID